MILFYLALTVAWYYMARWYTEQARLPEDCRIDEEWCGYFIGRQHCTTHHVIWDDGGGCPGEGVVL